MFKIIFNFEIKRWLKNPAFYIYSLVVLGLTILLTASAGGLFDNFKATTVDPVFINSPKGINGLINGLNTFVYFLFPTIIGASVYRDFKTNMHNVLFSYPLDKKSYLSAKLLSSFFISFLVILMTVIGYFIVVAFIIPADSKLIGPMFPMAYVDVVVYTLIPNLILFGSIVFALVTFTRNVYIGFIFILFLFLLQTMLSNFATNIDNRYYLALFDPFGYAPTEYLTRYWTIDEKNNTLLPLEGVFIYNRLIWLAFSALVLFFVYKTFSFSQATFHVAKKKDGKRITKNNFGSIIRLKLSDIHYDYSFFSRLKLIWNLSNRDFKFITNNWIFIITITLVLIILYFVISFSGELYGTETYPMTWKVVSVIAGLFGFFMAILIYLFSGMLLNRANTDRMNLLIDATSTPNWVLYFSKYIALVKMVIFIFLLSILIGMLYQAIHGFYYFEIGLYIKQLLGLELLKYLPLIAFAMFIQSLVKNYMAGFMICLVIHIGLPMLSRVGIEQAIYKFNSGAGYSYSDMDGFGVIRDYLIYRGYWLLFSIILICITLLLYKRGLVQSFKERLIIAKKRFKPAVAFSLILAVIGFFSVGYFIYYQNNVIDRYVSSKNSELETVEYEKKYKKYSKYPQPRIVSSKVNLDLFPESQDYKATVSFVLKNKTQAPIDTLYISHGDNLKKIELSTLTNLVVNDTIHQIKIYALKQPLLPNDSLVMISFLQNEENTFLKVKSPIIGNGTFINNSLFPSIGYNDGYELMDNTVRQKYNLPDREIMAEPTDSTALGNTYISNEADWIDFETTISTSEDQIAIAPGYLQKEWLANGRRYFHYKMDQKILNFYSFISARYEVKREKWKGLNLEIYYHKGHDFNLDRMMDGMKASFEYYGNEFSPYQFKQMRIVEFPQTYGTFAQAFANTVPFSESIGFIAKIDKENSAKVDYAYTVVSHELAHQWWAHQVIGANVKGSTMLSESLAEYSSLKVLERATGKGQMRRYLKEALDSYLRGRTGEMIKENPLMLNENQQYIHYNKGSLVMYAMSEMLGEKNFNNFLKQYVQKVAFQEPPYTTSVEFVDLLKQHTPDSLQYLIEDMYNTITLYDNAIDKVSVEKTKDDKYKVDIMFHVAKYRSGGKGEKSFTDKNGKTLSEKIDGNQIKSLPLSDYVDISVFAASATKNKQEMDNAIFTKRYKVDKIKNSVSIIVDQKPIEVGVDAYNMLLDINSEDNRKKI